MWNCGILGCDRPAVRGVGDCVICGNHLCPEHLQKPAHKCPTSQDEKLYQAEISKAENGEIRQLLDRINFDELRLKAQSLRNNLACTVQSPSYNNDGKCSLMGGMNFHIQIQFEDGVKWIARIRRVNATSPPADLRDYIIGSEVATLLFLEKTTIPTPKMIAYALEGRDNPVGVGYILMEDMPGNPLNWPIASNELQEKFLDQLASIYIELSRFPFDKIGCLDQPGGEHVGAFARECLTDFSQSGMHPLGPFEDLQDYCNASIELTLDLIYRQEMYADNQVDSYLIYRFLLDQVPGIFPKRPGDAEAFYLKHADDKGSHILVDEELNITGIIDWEWAYVTSASLAFNSPMLLLPVGEFFGGATSIGKDEKLFAELLERKGASSLADAVRNGRLQHQLAFCCNFDFCIGWEDLLCLFQGLRGSIEIDHQYDWEQWKEIALKRYQEDVRLQELLKRQ